MKNYWGSFLIISLFLFICVHGFGQEIVGSAGKTYSSNNASLNWTLGEISTITIYGNNCYLTQGFHQPPIEIQTIQHTIEIDYEIKVFPNPVISFFTIQISNFEKAILNYKLFNSEGKVILSGDNLSANTKVSMENLVASVYYLKVLNENELVGTYKVVKH